MAVCDRQKWDEYALVISRIVVDDGNWNVRASSLGCWVGGMKRILVWLGGSRMVRLGLNVLEYGNAARWKQERWYMVSSASW